MPAYPTREAFEQDYPNVKGTGLGETDSDLIVLVTRKVPESDLNYSDIIPASVIIDGQAYSTDLIPVGIPHGHDVPMAATEPADHQDKHRPLVGGISIGNDAVGAGTLGHPKLKHVESGDIVGLTNSHVAGSATEQYQPAELDDGAEEEPIGTLRESSHLDPSETQTTDSALIDVDPDHVSTEILGLGELVGFGDLQATFDDTAKASGRTTGVTSSSLRARDVSVDVAYGEQTLRFTGVNVYGDLSRPGDSGSLIVLEAEEGYHAVDLLFAGSDTVTLAISLAAVQEEHGELAVVGADDGNGGDDAEGWTLEQFHHRCYISPVAGVVDGDTLDIDEIALGLSTTKINERIRLLGVDTAELNSPDEDERELAARQAQFVKDWLAEGVDSYGGWYPFALDTHKDEYDSFGRLLTHVRRRSDGESLADAILEEWGDEYRYEIQEQLANLAR